MQKFIPYVHVKNAKEATDFYANVFNGKVGDISYGDSVPSMENMEEAKNIILHAEVKFKDGSMLYVSDAHSEDGGMRPKTVFGDHISLLINFETEEEITESYNKLKDSPNVFVEMELSDAFWGSKFAMIKDRFNIMWMLNYTLPKK